MKLNKKLYVGALVIVVAALILWLAHDQGKKYAINTTSKSPTAQTDYSGGSPRKSSSDTGTNQGGVKDNDGQKTSSSNSGITASSGLISLTSPASGSVVKNGDTISGSAKVDKVSFRVIDDDFGVIAQGQLNVVNNSYSGTLIIHPKSSTGRLDVFSTNSLGAEENEIQIPIKF